MGNSQIVASKHYLQLRDAHFDRASSEVVVFPAGDQSSHVGTKTGLVAIQVASETREMVKTEATVKKNPAKLNVLRGSADGFASLPDQRITRPGLEPGTTEPKSVVLPLHHRVTWTSAVQSFRRRIPTSPSFRRISFSDVTPKLRLESSSSGVRDTS